MAARTIKAKEMFGAEPEFVSLVGRGANGVPFRIMKSEDTTMSLARGLNLGALFARRAQKADATPTVLAVVAVEGVDVDAAKELIAKAGLEFDAVAEVEGGVVFANEGVELEGDHIITVKLDETAAVIVNVQKEFNPFSGSTDFDENLASLGFFPGLRLAQDVFADVAFTAMAKADSKTAAAEVIGKLTTDFGAAVANMVSDLPDSVFKMEEVLKSSIEGQPGFPLTGKTSPPPGGAAEDQEGGEEIAERPVVNKDDEPESKAKSSDGGEDQDDADKLKGKDKKKDAESDGLEFTPGSSEWNLQQAFKSFQKGIDATFAGLKEQVASIDIKVTEAVEVAKAAQLTAKKTDDTLSNTVISSAPGDESLDTDGESGSGLDFAHIDTAFEARDARKGDILNQSS